MILGIPALMMGGKRRPIYVSASSNQVSQADMGTKSVNLLMPTGTAIGDLMVMYIVTSSNSSNGITLPVGFTSIVNQDSGGSTVPGHAVAYRVAQAGDTNWFVNTMAYSILGAILTFRSASETGAYSTAASVNGASIDLELGSILSLLFAGASGSTTAPNGTVPTGMTERVKIQSTLGASRALLQVSTDMTISNGPTGSKASTSTGTGSRRSIMLEVKGK